MNWNLPPLLINQLFLLHSSVNEISKQALPKADVLQNGTASCHWSGVYCGLRAALSQSTAHQVTLIWGTRCASSGLYVFLKMNSVAQFKWFSSKLIFPSSYKPKLLQEFPPFLRPCAFFINFDIGSLPHFCSFLCLSFYRVVGSFTLLAGFSKLAL